MPKCILKDKAKNKAVYGFKNDISNAIKTSLTKTFLNEYTQKENDKVIFSERVEK